MANQREQNPDEWNRHALQIMLNMFPADRRPTLLHPYTDNQFNGHNVVCDRLIVGIDQLLFSSHLTSRPSLAIGNLQGVDLSSEQPLRLISSVLRPTNMSISSLAKNSFQAIN